jgi:phage terminase large subunit-like protein
MVEHAKSSVDAATLERVLDIARQLQRERGYNRLQTEYWYTNEERPGEGGPYGWQLEFHASQGRARERAMIAANRVGKSRTADAELAMHLTGIYPPWWRGLGIATIDHPIDCWCASESNEASRDINQVNLLGDTLDRELMGTGWIPRECIDFDSIRYRSCGVTGVIDNMRVLHKPTGKWSRLAFKSYEQKASKFQGTAKHLIRLDEQPPDDVAAECKMRTITTGGQMIETFTPLKGMTTRVQHYLEGGEGVFCLTVGWDDAPHLTEAIKAEALRGLPPHEIEARTKGTPVMGEGLILPIQWDTVAADLPPGGVPGYWRQICGIDFGFDHPAAAVWIAYDADRDCVWMVDAYRERHWTAPQHAARINARGRWIPVAWPHDGLQAEKSSGRTLCEQYRDAKVNMLYESARYDDDTGGRQDVEPWVVDLVERCRTGRFRVVRGDAMRLLVDEARMWHRKNGRINAVRDDVIAALRYAMMMVRYARTEAEALEVRSERTTGALDDPPAGAFGAGANDFDPAICGMAVREVA